MKYAIIPARGGSKRVPRKNLRPFAGKPLLSYSILAAQRAGIFERVYVSTEDKEIADVAGEYGASVLCRPGNLAADEIGTQEVAKYHLKMLREPPDFCCVVYATCPFLTPQDLKDSFKLLKRDYVVTEGWLYWGRPYWFIHGKPLTESVKYDVGERWIDINTLEDLAKAEEMYAALHQKEAA